MNTRRKQQIERSAKDPLTIEKVRTEKAHKVFALCQLIINIERLVKQLISSALSRRQFSRDTFAFFRLHRT